MSSQTNTKIISELYFDKENPILNEIIIKARKQSFKNFRDRVLKLSEKMFAKNWQKVANKSFYFIKSNHCYIVDMARHQCSRSYWESKVDGVTVVSPGLDTLRNLFFENKSSNPLITGNGDRIVNDSYTGNSNDRFWLGYNSNCRYDFIRDYGYSGYIYSTSDTGILKIPVCYIGGISNIEFAIKNNFIFEVFDDDDKKLFGVLKNLYSNGYIKFRIDNEPVYTDKFREEYIECSDAKDDILEFAFKTESISESMIIDFDDKLNEKFTKSLLECDYVRADIEPYDEKRISDPNRGHWDLWYDDKYIQDKIKVKTSGSFCARNPAADIRWDGIVGIDFGTKSTVVVYQDGDENTMPIRIGNGRFNKAVTAKDYENPTFMQFIDIESFLENYKASDGRPFTKLDDLTVSHKAKEMLQDNKNTNNSDYYTFFSGLKKWCINKKDKGIIKDTHGAERQLPPFCEIGEDDFNPIEIYAYYLGLFINNMYNGIYMDYMLSFPVKYERTIRQKVLESFERGIKKSLPQSILNDEKIMQNFRISQGASEPAAYAVCALQQYGFGNTDKNVYYSVFDFGGGTTDFDFGVWKSASEKESRRYDNVITHFGDGGDCYLGGENILELMAFEVFKANSEILREKNIKFSKPVDAPPSVGCETLIDNSEEAKLNTVHLMEVLRPIWEGGDFNNQPKMILSSGNGKDTVAIDLNVDKDELLQLIVNRIEKGVKNFFEALDMAFDNENAKDLNQIQIFLAGNASKSPIVKNLFEEYSEDYFEHFQKKFNVENSSYEEFFKIYPPLGTDEAYEIQEKLGLSPEKESLTSPNGKTGVAYGLIECRKGSRIKVVSEINENDEIKFNYYLGYNQKKLFKVLIDRNIKYNKWVEFIDACESDFEIYYTNLPEAAGNKLPIDEVKKKKCRIAETHDEGAVYVRASAPSEIEYVVALPNEIESGQYITDIVKIALD